MIQTFSDEGTEDIYNGQDTRAARQTAPKSIWPTARRKLSYLNAARELRDLQAPPGNRLEQLAGNLKGRWSIRINDQYRIVFTWSGGNADEVWISDYH